jgi:hypothetical protein
VVIVAFDFGTPLIDCFCQHAGDDLPPVIFTNLKQPKDRYRFSLAHFVEVQPLLETPWSVAILDFAFPETRGQRPADFDTTLKFGIALTRLAAEDPAVHRLTLEVQNLLRPLSVYRDPTLVQRVLAKMTEALTPG